MQRAAFLLSKTHHCLCEVMIERVNGIHLTILILER